jgi:hypothetical protein
MKSIPFHIIIVLILTILIAPPSLALADTITLDDGQTLKGTFQGISEGRVRFEAFGNAMEFDAGDVQSLSLDKAAPVPTTPQPAQAPAQPPAPARAQAMAGTVPAGTVLLVKTNTELITGRVSKGDPFITTLETAVTVNGQVLLPKGTRVFGRVSDAVKGGRLARIARLVIELNDIEGKSGRIPIRTDQQGFEGERQGTLRKVAIGAAIGSIDDGSEGAEDGAAYGGVAAAMTPGNQIRIPPGMLLEFRLQSPVEVR